MSGLSNIFPQLEIPAEALAAYNSGKAAESRQKYADAIEHYNYALSFETSPIFHSRVLDRRGNCYWLLGQFDTAARDFHQALDVTNDPGQRARARARLGEVADARGWYDEALVLYSKALGEGMSAGDLLSIGRSHRGLGIVHRRQGNAEKSLYHLAQALASFRQAGEAREQARVLTSLGRTYLARGEYQQAITSHREALQIFERLDDRWRIALCLNDLGECHQALYDMRTALDFHRQALAIALADNVEVIEPDVKRNMGIDLVGCGDYEEGLNHLVDALAVAKALGNREQQALTLYALAQAYLNNDNLIAAEQAVVELTDIAEELDADRYRALAAYQLGGILMSKGDRAAATAAFQRAMLAAQSSLDRGVLWKLHAVISSVVEDPSVAAVHQAIAADFIQQTVEPIQDDRLREIFVHAPPVMAALAAVNIDPEELLRK